MLGSNDKTLKFHIMMLMLKRNKAVPDTMISFFAASELYRYVLYRELKVMKRLDLFPSKYYSHLDIARSELLNLNNFIVPDSVEFLYAYPLQYKGRDAQVFFFKYRKTRDDPHWKFATIGLIPVQTGIYDLEDIDKEEDLDYHFSELTSTKIDMDESLQEQMKKIMKRLVYSKRKSAVQFYTDAYGSEYDMSFNITD
jgi:hypothetical protein